MKLLSIARCAILVSYMATCLQLLFLFSKSLNSTFEVRLQHVVMNGAELMGLGSHEGFSYCPESLALHNCRKHDHTSLVMSPLIAVCTLHVVRFALVLLVTPPVCGLCSGKPWGPRAGAHGAQAQKWAWLWRGLQDTVLQGIRPEDGKAETTVLGPPKSPARAL